MDAAKKLITRIWRHAMHDSLRRNATLLVASQAVTAASTFGFWIIGARLFDANTIGLATAFVSFAALSAVFTHLGLPTTVIRFLPTSQHKAGLVSAALAVVFACSLAGGLAALLLLQHLAPDLSFVRHSLSLSGLLIVLIASNALMPVIDNTLMAFRKGEYVLGKTLLTSLPRLLVPFAVASLALTGLISVYAVVLALGIAYGLVIIKSKLLPSATWRPRPGELLTHRKFAASSYLGGLVGILPSTLVPIIVLNQLGATQAAYYYMPMQLAVFLGVIASATSQALVSETSQHTDARLHRTQTLSAAKHLYKLLVPAAIVLAIGGWFILRLYGTDYANTGYVPLLILCAASLFVGLNWLGDTWLIITQRLRAFFWMNACNALFVVAGVYLLAQHGLRGVALGWLIGQVLSVLVYALVFGQRYLRAVVLRSKAS